MTYEDRLDRRIDIAHDLEAYRCGECFDILRDGFVGFCGPCGGA